VTCLWFIAEPTATSPTKRCNVGPKEIALETSASSVVELWRSGPDALQGTFRPAGAVGASGAGMSGTQVFLNRRR
jgi:hypothetical protein